jgi:2-dehydropantoate 2-reductase
VGSGAIGGYYGARLAQHGQDVHFLLRRDLQAVREHGWRIRSEAGDFTLPQVNAAASTAEIGPVDLVIISLKTTANPALHDLIPPLLKADTLLLTLQNGLGNEEFLAQHWGVERVLGGVCFTCINRTGPGEIHHIAHGLITLGEHRGGLTPRLEQLATLFQASGIPCNASESLAYTRWKKLVWNIPFNGLSIAAQEATTEDVLGSPALLESAVGLMEETIQAAKLLGHTLPATLVEDELARTRTMGPYRTSSLLDFQAGLDVEVESIWGEPCRQARAAGASVGRMEQIYDLIRYAVARRTAASR